MKLEKDCCFTYGNHWFRYRVGAVIIEDGCILLAKNENSEDDYYYSVGGGVHINEKADEAIEREIFEETGVHYEVERLLSRNIILLFMQTAWNERIGLS